jgi:hypothetical protein
MLASSAASQSSRDQLRKSPGDDRDAGRGAYFGGGLFQRLGAARHQRHIHAFTRQR